jgi:hypothetical protein
LVSDEALWLEGASELLQREVSELVNLVSLAVVSRIPQQEPQPVSLQSMYEGVEQAG